MTEIRYSIEDGSDFLIEWNHDYAGSISTVSHERGQILIECQAVPYFLYVLAKGLDLSFIHYNKREKILKCEAVLLARCKPEEIRDIMEQSAKFNSDLWKGLYEGERINAWRIGQLRQEDGMTDLMLTLEARGIDYSSLTYVGRIHATGKHTCPVHMLRSPEEETYLGQCRAKPQIVRLSRDDRIATIQKIIDSYDYTISGALKTLLEESIESKKMS